MSRMGYVLLLHNWWDDDVFPTSYVMCLYSSGYCHRTETGFTALEETEPSWERAVDAADRAGPKHLR